MKLIFFSIIHNLLNSRPVLIKVFTFLRPISIFSPRKTFNVTNVALLRMMIFLFVLTALFHDFFGEPIL